MSYNTIQKVIDQLRAELEIINMHKSLLANKIVPEDGSSIKIDIPESFKQLQERALGIQEKIRLLERSILSETEKRNQRIESINFAKKFFNENKNDIKFDFYKAYLDFMDSTVNINTAEVQEIRAYLDEKRFQMNIPSSFVDKIRHYPHLQDLLKDLRKHLQMISA